LEGLAWQYRPTKPALSGGGLRGEKIWRTRLQDLHEQKKIDPSRALRDGSFVPA